MNSDSLAICHPAISGFAALTGIMDTGREESGTNAPVLLLFWCAHPRKIFTGEGVKRVKKKPLLKPGNKAPESAQYEIVGPQGGKARGKERTVVKGEPLPPTPERGQKYRLSDRTKH
jgi:hypothetical protein